MVRSGSDNAKLSWCTWLVEIGSSCYATFVVGLNLAGDQSMSVVDHVEGCVGAENSRLSLLLDSVWRPAPEAPLLSGVPMRCLRAIDMGGAWDAHHMR